MKLILNYKNVEFSNLTKELIIQRIKSFQEKNFTTIECTFCEHKYGDSKYLVGSILSKSANDKRVYARAIGVNLNLILDELLRKISKQYHKQGKRFKIKNKREEFELLWSRERVSPDAVMGL